MASSASAFWPTRSIARTRAGALHPRQADDRLDVGRLERPRPLERLLGAAVVARVRGLARLLHEGVAERGPGRAILRGSRVSGLHRSIACRSTEGHVGRKRRSRGRARAARRCTERQGRRRRRRPAAPTSACRSPVAQWRLGLTRVLAVRRPGVGRRRVREDLVVDLVVGVDVVADHRDRGVRRAAGDGGQRDVDDVVAEAPAVRPAADDAPAGRSCRRR